MARRPKGAPRGLENAGKVRCTWGKCGRLVPQAKIEEHVRKDHQGK